MGKVGAHVSEANVDLSRLVQEKNDAIRQPADINQTVEMIKSRLARVRPRCGQWACQAALAAYDLEPSGGRGRCRRLGRASGGNKCVLKRVKVLFRRNFSHTLELTNDSALFLTRIPFAAKTHDCRQREGADGVSPAFGTKLGRCSGRSRRGLCARVYF